MCAMAGSDSAAPPPSVPRHWGNVPQRNKNFTGRVEVLEQLRQGVASNITAVVPEDPLPQALQGFGGVGKTAVAVEYAYRYQSEYDLIWWIPAENVALVRSSLAGLAGALGLESASTTGIDVTTRAVLEALRLGTPVRRWLLIFDNADKPEDVLPLIPHGPGHVLITSRNHEWQQQVETVPMDVFTRDESKEFLAKRVSKGLSERDADRLAERLGDLPLALVQASAMLAQGAMQVDEYLRLIDDEITKILMEGTPPEYPAPMTAVWKISVESVTKRQPQAQDLLRCCAFFGPEPIPSFVFRRSSQAGSGISELLSQPMLLSNAIRELGRFALIRIDGTYISVHRLTQALVRAELSGEEQSAYRQEVHSMLAACAPKQTSKRETWSRWAELVAHVGAETTDLSHCRIPEHRALAIKTLRYLGNIGDFMTCRLLAERFVEQWTRDSNQDNEFVIDARRYLGNALREVGEYGIAYEMIESTLANSERVLGPRNPLTLALRNAFGADLRAQGEFDRARELDLDTLKLHEEEFGSDDPQTLRVRNNVALDYGLDCRYEEAQRLHEQVYIMQRDDASEAVTASEMLSSQVGMARAVRLCGNFASARDLGEDAYAFGRDELGAEHYLTLRAATDLSIALRRIADGREEGLELAQRIFELSERLLGDTNPGTLAAGVTLSNNLRTLGRLDDALTEAKRSYDNYRKVYGADHPYSFACAGNLAVLSRLMDDPERARQLDQDAHEGLTRKLSATHFYTLTVATNLASDLAMLGDAAAARDLGIQTRERLVHLVGDRHSMTLGCAANLVLDLRATGAKADADSLFAVVERGYEQLLGEDHPETRAVVAGERLDFDFDPPPI
jgi:tetratricopeptide (TPR) repeat protein